jgi:hypothetical protein
VRHVRWVRVNHRSHEMQKPHINRRMDCSMVQTIVDYVLEFIVGEAESEFNGSTIGSLPKAPLPSGMHIRSNII